MRFVVAVAGAWLLCLPSVVAQEAGSASKKRVYRGHPGIELERAERMIREIQRLRHDPEGAAELQGEGWTAWTDRDVRCRSFGALARLKRALVEKNACTEEVAKWWEKWEKVTEYTEETKTLKEETLNRLDVLAATFDLAGPTEVKCLAKIFVESYYVDENTKDEYKTRIDALIDLKSALDFVRVLSKAPKAAKWAAGTRPNLDAIFDAPLAEGVEGVANVGQPLGWAETFKKAIGSLDIAVDAEISTALDRAVDSLRRCRLEEARQRHQYAKDTAHNEVIQARQRVQALEQLVYCRAPDPADKLYAFSGYVPHEAVIESAPLPQANRWQQKILERYLATVGDERLSAGRFSTQREHLDRVKATMTRIRDSILRVVEDSCREGRDVLMSHGSQLQDVCAPAAQAEVYPDGDRGFQELALLLRRRNEARQAGRSAIEAAVALAEQNIATCDFGKVPGIFIDTIESYHQTWLPQGFALPHFWDCAGIGDRVEPVRQRASSAMSTLRSAIDASRQAIGPVTNMLDDCQWDAAAGSLESARRSLAGALHPLAGVSCQVIDQACPEAGPKCHIRPLGLQVSNLQQRLDGSRVAAEAELRQKEATLSSLVASIGAELAVAESPAADRCARLVTARSQMAALRSLDPPACASPAFDARQAHLQEAARRADYAQNLYHTDLTRLQADVERAANSCEVGLLESSIAAIQALPPVCGSGLDRATLLGVMQALQNALDQRIEAARRAVEAAHQTSLGAWPSCDTAGLDRAEAKVLGLSECVLSQLSPIEQTNRYAVLQRGQDAEKIRAILGTYEPQIRTQLGIDAGTDAAGCRRRQRAAQEARALLSQMQTRLGNEVHPTAAITCTASVESSVQGFVSTAPLKCEEPSESSANGEKPKSSSGGNWNRSLQRSRRERSTSSEAEGDTEPPAPEPPPQPAAEVDALIRAAASAYAHCKYGDALAHLDKIKPPTQGAVALRGHIAQQRSAEAIFKVARRERDPVYAKMAVAASIPPHLSPPCQRVKAEQLVSELTAGQAAEVALAERQRSQAEWERKGDLIAGMMIDALGAYNRAQRGERRSSTGGGGGAAPPTGSGGSTSSDNRRCIVQFGPSPGTERSFITKAGNAQETVYVIWTADSNSACGSAQACLEAYLRKEGQAYKVVASYSSRGAAKQAAERLCGR